MKNYFIKIFLVLFLHFTDIRESKNFKDENKIFQKKIYKSVKTNKIFVGKLNGNIFKFPLQKVKFLQIIFCSFFRPPQNTGLIFEKSVEKSSKNVKFHFFHVLLHIWPEESLFWIFCNFWKFFEIFAYTGELVDK